MIVNHHAAKSFLTTDLAPRGLTTTSLPAKDYESQTGAVIAQISIGKPREEGRDLRQTSRGYLLASRPGSQAVEKLLCWKHMRKPRLDIERRPRDPVQNKE